MIDVSWQEILVIAVVAVVVIGPKDLPVAIRTVAGWVKKAREMAGEFQRGVDEMVREAELSDVRKQVEQAANERLREPYTGRDHGEAKVEQQVGIEVGAEGEAMPRHLEPLRAVALGEGLLQPELIGAGGGAAGEAGGEVGDPGDDARGMVDGRLLGHGLSSSISPAGMAPGSRRRASRSTQLP